MSEKLHDVVIVGAGPVGLAMGRMLGLHGHDVVVLERWPEPYPLPRAVHFDDEIGRVFGSMGLAEQVKAISAPVTDHYEWRNAAGEALVRIDWSGIGPNGWPVASFFSQPQLEAVLADAVEAMPNVTLRRGAEVVAIVERGDEVEVIAASAVHKQRKLRARFVIGCDGANSFVRERMGVTMHDQGFFFDWLIVDTVPLDHQEWSPQNWQLCDPTRPTTIVSGGPGRRRWEFMRLPGEDRDDLNTTERAWELLEPWGRTPDNTQLERHAVYTFAARWADRWNHGRLAIAGDAAHQMPPFAGQGMCSGIRDAANLAWKLDRILRGASGIELLDSYTSERSEHLQHAIAMSVELGRVICVLDEQQAAERDARMIDGGADPARVLPVAAMPVLGRGVTGGRIATLGGTLAPQFPVAAAGREDLSDEITGHGAILLLRNATPLSSALLDGSEVRAFVLGTDPGADLHDVSGAWTDWFDTHDVGAVLIRPDHYIFGATPDPADAPGLLTAYRHLLHPTASAAVPA